MDDAGPEPTYEEKNERTPTPGVKKALTNRVNPDQTVIRILPVCYSVIHFVNSSLNNE